MCREKAGDLLNDVLRSQNEFLFLITVRNCETFSRYERPRNIRFSVIVKLLQLANGKGRFMQFRAHSEVRFRTKLESPITINEPFNLVVFVSKVKFGIHLVTLNYRTDMFEMWACKFSHLSVSNDFRLKSSESLQLSIKVFSSVPSLDL